MLSERYYREKYYRNRVILVKLCGIILAAGNSARAGDFKLTYKILGKPVIEYVIESMLVVCESLRVVTGYKAERLSYLPQKYSKIRLIHNEQYKNGMFGSIKAGLYDLDADRAFMIPGDCPAVNPQTYCKMAVSKGDILVPVYRGKKGHPVLINKNRAESICSSGSPSLRDYISNFGYQAVETDDSGILLDIDYSEDFGIITRYFLNASKPISPLASFASRSAEEPDEAYIYPY